MSRVLPTLGGTRWDGTRENTEIHSRRLVELKTDSLGNPDLSGGLLGQAHREFIYPMN